jgi:hypothetical protein
MAKVLVVFTAKGSTRLESEGGTGHWAVSSRSVRDCEYVVCTRNTDPASVDDFGDLSSTPHGAAFLVGKVTGLEKTYFENGRQRYRVVMSEVAEVLVSGFWDGSRIPTRYLSKAEAEARGLNFDNLKFRPINKASVREAAPAPSINATTSLPGISINEAKVGLSLRFGVTPDDIDIVVRG